MGLRPLEGVFDRGYRKKEGRRAEKWKSI